MDSHYAVILCVWLSLTIISGFFIWTGGATLGNYVFIGLAFFFALIFTSELLPSKHMPEKKPETELLKEFKDLRQKLELLTKEVEVIKKVIEE